MNDVHLALLRRREDRQLYKQLQEEKTKKKYKNLKPQLEKEFKEDEQATDKQKSFYEKIFKAEEGKPIIKKKPKKKKVKFQKKEEIKKAPEGGKKINGEGTTWKTKEEYRAEKVRKKRRISKQMRRRNSRGQPMLGRRLQTILSKVKKGDK